ncbi:MAG: hypothetical protein RLZZ624_443 [Cyanobacteriota bacterium]|jgi:hypothetical protein
MVPQRRSSDCPLDLEDDDAKLAALRDQGAHLPWPLRLLALLGALAFVMVGLASALIPLREPAPRPQPPLPAGPEQPQA